MTTVYTWVLYAGTALILIEFALCLLLISDNIGLRLKVGALMYTLSLNRAPEAADRERVTAAEQRWRAERWPAIYRPKEGGKDGE